MNTPPCGWSPHNTTWCSRDKGKRRAVTVINRSAPKALLSFADTASYKPKFMYHRQIEKALASRGVRDAFASELARAVRKR
jgi:uroporphyrinogen-III synthase